MMNRIYEEHKSSILDLDANLLCLAMYLIPLLAGLFFSQLRVFGWLIPLLVFFLEKDSSLVKFHAVQCLVLQIVMAILNVVLWIMAALSAGVSLLIGFSILGFISSLGIAGIITALLSLLILVFEIIGMIKSYQWESYRLPFFGKIADCFVKE